MRNRRISDQILILDSVACVREELREADARGANTIEMSEIYTRLVSLQSCLNERLILKHIREINIRREVYGQHSKRRKQDK